MKLRQGSVAIVLWLCSVHAAQAGTGVSLPSIPDVEVIDQDGLSHRFYRDLVKGKTVVINFIYTACKASCPAVTGLLSGVHQRLRAADQAVTLLSVTVDPVHDRPAQLKAYAAQFGAGAGWRFLTGAQRDITSLLASLEVTLSNKADHPAMIVIGNDAAGVWTRLYGEASVPMVIEGLAAATGPPDSFPAAVPQ